MNAHQSQTSPTSKHDDNNKNTVNVWPDKVQTISYTSTFDDTQQCMLFYEAKMTNDNNPVDNNEHWNDSNHNDDGLKKASENHTMSQKRPLLVALHTWSSTYKQTANGSQTAYARWCINVNWHFIHPNFRGPNWTYDACGSDAAIQDIHDAISYVKSHCSVDEDRVYGVGVSGGAHMGLLLAGKMPNVWAGLSVWAPIVDLSVWWAQRVNGVRGARRYATHIEKVVGGQPNIDNDFVCSGTTIETENITRKNKKGIIENEQEEKEKLGEYSKERVMEECRRRSPITHLKNAINIVNIDINAGVHDGRTHGGAVPFTHALHAYNALMPSSEDQLGHDFINQFYETQSPSLAIRSDDGSHLKSANKETKTKLSNPANDEMYGNKPIIFQRESNYVRVTVFRGGHEIIHNAALNWLAAQRRGRPAIWNPREICYRMDVKDCESQSGK